MSASPARLLWPAAALLLSSVTNIFAQLPAARLGGVYPAGANPGGTIDVTIAGDDLDDVDTLVFSHPGIKAERKMAEPGPFDKGPVPVTNTFVVNVAGNVPQGVYEARVAGKYGMSNPRAFTVSDVAEALEVEPNNDRESATEIETPVVVNGRSDGAADVDFFKLPSAAGQRIIVTGYVRRIDSAMDAVVVVYDAAGRELGNSRDAQRGDPLVDFTAAAAGDYYVKVHDAVYQGGGDYVYRLAVGSLPHIDYVFPPAGEVGGNRQFTLFGRNLPGGESSGVAIGGKPLQRLNVTVPIPATAVGGPLALDALVESEGAGLDAVQHRLKTPQGSSNAALIGVATAPPVLEQEPNNEPASPQTLTVPCEVMGRFDPARDDDWYEFTAKAGEAYTVEVISSRMGYRTDPMLLIQQVLPPKEVAEGEAEEGEKPPEEPKEQIKQIAFVQESGDYGAGKDFDTRSGDPVHRFTAAEDGMYRILVRDGYNALAADPRQIYRLAVRTNQPDFRLAAAPEDSASSVLLRKGGQAAIRVVAFRQDGFDGEIHVTATGLPEGVTCSDAIIGPARNSAAIVLTAAANAAPAHAFIQITGEATIDGQKVERAARVGAAMQPSGQQQNNQPTVFADARITENLAISVSAGEAAPVTLSAGGGQVWETSRAGILKIPYTRGGPFQGKVTLTPRDLPANIDIRAFDSNVGSGEYQLPLKADTPLGAYTVYFSGIAEQLDYSRNPEAAAAAAERKKEVDQINAKQAAEAKAAADAKTAADKAAADATAKLQAATQAKQTTDKALADATAAAKAAADKAAAAKQAAAASQDDANLAAAATQAQKAADDAAAKVKTAETAVADAQKALDEVTKTAEAANKTKDEADQLAAEKANLAKLAADLKAQTDKLVTDLTNAANPKKVNVPVVSTPFTIKITPAPITLAEIKPPAAIKQGEKLEVPVTIARLYGYNDEVALSAAAPSGVSGMSIPNVNIAAGQAQAKLAVTAAADATPGTHEFTVRAQLRLNNQNLTVETPLTLQIEAAPPAEKQ